MMNVRPLLIAAAALTILLAAAAGPVPPAFAEDVALRLVRA
jgi:hypothetical protein